MLAEKQIVDLAEIRAQRVNPSCSHPFPWLTIINEAGGTCIARVQLNHGNHLDIPLTPGDAATAIKRLGEFLQNGVCKDAFYQTRSFKFDRARRIDEGDCDGNDVGC